MNRKNKLLALLAVLLLVVIGVELHQLSSTGSASDAIPQDTIPQDTIAMVVDTALVNTQGRDVPAEIVEQAPAINTDWQYEVDEDKLNDTKNYKGNIMSTDGGMMFSISDIDLMGNGHYTTVLAFGWFSEAMPECYDDIYVGVKFPGDDKWKKYVVSCKGRAASFSLMIPDELVNQLTSNSRFSILLGNTEFQFHAKSPLRWSH